jgi:hypothetical protein
LKAEVLRQAVVHVAGWVALADPPIKESEAFISGQD